MLRHSAPSLPSNSGGIACWVAELNAKMPPEFSGINKISNCFKLSVIVYPKIKYFYNVALLYLISHKYFHNPTATLWLLKQIALQSDVRSKFYKFTKYFTFDTTIS